MIDLRSDTVTNPTDEMRKAMATAIVGDDVYDDDPTVKELEALAAKLLGKEAALFVPSGTFGNQLALFTHCKRGTEIILADDCHIVQHEVGGASVIAGVNFRTLNTVAGKMDLDEIRLKIREEDIHYPETSLVCLENPFNGIAVDIEYMKSVRKLASEFNLPIHLDGARIFNASVALNAEVSEIAKYSDSIMFCLSKGLCSPVGSMLVGDKAFILKAKKKRKLLGGGLRQAGILAAAGLISLKEMTKRLNIDHENAKYLAEKLKVLPYIDVNEESLHTNMVFFKVKNGFERQRDTLVEKLMAENIKISAQEQGTFRFVTHYWVSKDDIDKVASVMKDL